MEPPLAHTCQNHYFLGKCGTTKAYLSRSNCPANIGSQVEQRKEAETHRLLYLVGLGRFTHKGGFVFRRW